MEGTDLTRPQRNERTEGETGLNLGLTHLRDGSRETSRECPGSAGLDLNLGHFKRAECDIGEDLRGSGTSEPDGGFVLVRELLASSVHVDVLEDLVQTVLEHALQRVTDERGSETFPKTSGTFLLGEERKGRAKALVFCGVDLPL